MSDQLNTENVVEEVNNVVTDVVPETTPVMETTEAEFVEAVTEEKRKTKSFFDIFKKDKPAEEAVETPAAEEATETAEAVEAEAVEGEGEAATDEVPVETAPAKKSSLCGLCAFGKKEEAPATEEAPAATEEAAEEVAATAEEAVAEAPATEEGAAVTEEAAPVAEEEAPVAAADATEEAAEGEAVALVDEADIARAGVLYKSGKFFKSNMNERHCRLLTTGAFHYSKTEDFTKAHECMINAETTTVAFMAEGEDAPHKYRFELHCCGSVSTYAADTEEDRDEWIRALETVKESVVPAVVEEAAAETSEEAPAAEAE